MSEQRQILKNSQIMVVVTMISRVFGLARDQLIAFLLGATRLGDIWAVSFMLPNLFRRLIGEGAMSSAFVPILSEMTEKEQARATLHFMRGVLTLILIVSVLIVTLMVLALPWVLPDLARLLAPGGSLAEAGTYERLVAPTRLMFPYLIFISLASICQGVLNVHHRFGLPAATPIVLNLCIIAFGFGMRDTLGSPLWGLCSGVLVGGFFQFFLQWAYLYRLGFRLWPLMNFWTARTREAVRLWLPTTFSAGVVQINALVSTVVALNLVAGGAMAVQTSSRLMELVLGVFTVALSTSLLPALSRQRARNDDAAMAESLFRGIGVMSMITVPAALGLILAGPSVIAVLFERGAFDARGTRLTYTALIYHAMALIPISWYRLSIQVFYARKRAKVAAGIAVAGALINITGCFLFPGLFPADISHAGVALATLVSSWILFLVAIIWIHRGFALRWPRRLNRDLIMILLAAMSLPLVWMSWGDPARILGLGELTIKVFVSCLIYGILVWLFNIAQIRDWMKRGPGSST